VNPGTLTNQQGRYRIAPEPVYRGPLHPTRPASLGTTLMLPVAARFHANFDTALEEASFVKLRELAPPPSCSRGCGRRGGGWRGCGDGRPVRRVSALHTRIYLSAAHVRRHLPRIAPWSLGTLGRPVSEERLLAGSGGDCAALHLWLACTYTLYTTRVFGHARCT
jgi:hypothetical protein